MFGKSDFISKRPFANALVFVLVCSVMFGCVHYSTGTYEFNGSEKGKWSGYVVFEGEFRLYASAAALRENSENCLSGALPLPQQLEAAKKFDKQTVEIEGKLEKWIVAPDILSLNHKGSEIRNLCDNDRVILASSMRKLK